MPTDRHRLARRAGAVSTIAAGASTVALCAGAATSVAAATLQTVTVHATKHSLTVSGPITSGAVRIVTNVTGEAEDAPTFVLLKPGVTPAEIGKAVAKIGDGPLDAVDPYGTIEYSSADIAKGHPAPGYAVLPAGSYVAFSSGNAVTTFTVTQSAAPASLPKPAATVTAIDLAFRGATTLTRGSVVRFVNKGYLIHMFLAVPVKNLKTAKEGEAALAAGQVNKAKSLASGPAVDLTGPISSGVAQESTVTVAPGLYVLICVMNTQDGKEHFQDGMYRTIRVVR